MTFGFKNKARYGRSRVPAPLLDFRSDTVTQPTAEMRRAMAEADLGDDVMGEDPTVNRLQEVAAKKVGMEAALFVPTGTMANQIAIWTHTRRQGAVVCESDAHILVYEAGAPSLLSNVMVRGVTGRRGVFTPSDVEPLLDPDALHAPQVTLLEIENSHTRAGGTVWTPAQTRSLAAFAREHRIPVHLDGARIFNAAVAQDVPVTDLTRHVDTVSFCLSKGLSAPVGSLLCGPRELIERARIVRKILGGGMRQAGVLAAAGLLALEKNVDRLQEDHQNARRLAAGLAKIGGLEVDLDSVHTNIVMVDVSGTGLDEVRFCAELAKRGVKAAPRDVGPVVRFVTHRHIRRQDVETTLEAAAAIVKRSSQTKRIDERSKTRIRTRAR